MAEPRKILTLNAISARGLARLPVAYTVGGDVADPAVAECQQVFDHQTGATIVVHRQRTIVGAGQPGVHQHRGQAMRQVLLQEGGIGMR